MAQTFYILIKIPFLVNSLIECKSLCALLILKCKDNCNGQHEKGLIIACRLLWILIVLIASHQFIISASLLFIISSLNCNVLIKQCCSISELTWYLAYCNVQALPCAILEIKTSLWSALFLKLILKFSSTMKWILSKICIWICLCDHSIKWLSRPVLLRLFI